MTSESRRGLHDLDDLAMRCDVNPGGRRCWIWHGGTSKGRPVAYMDGRNVSGARITAILTGRQAERKPNQRWTVVCGDKLCLSPRCLVLRTHAQALMIARRAGRMEKTPAQIARHQAASIRRARPAWMVQWAIESQQTARAAAFALGVHPSTVSGWRNGTIRTMCAADPFGQLVGFATR